MQAEDFAQPTGTQLRILGARCRKQKHRYEGRYDPTCLHAHSHAETPSDTRHLILENAGLKGNMRSRNKTEQIQWKLDCSEPAGR